MRYPFDVFVIGTKYGVKGTNWKAGYHSGVDFKSKNYGGDGKIHPLYAGQVVRVTTTGSYGKCVYIKHNDGYTTLYAHMSSVSVAIGQEVQESTILGFEGSTGNSTGLHCHVEVHKGEYHYPSNIDPLQFIKERIDEEVIETTKIKLNGVIKTVKCIKKDGNNFVKLQDIRDDKIEVSYKDGLPVINVK